MNQHPNGTSLYKEIKSSREKLNFQASYWHRTPQRLGDDLIDHQKHKNTERQGNYFSKWEKRLPAPASGTQLPEEAKLRNITTLLTWCYFSLNWIGASSFHSANTEKAALTLKHLLEESAAAHCTNYHHASTNPARDSCLQQKTYIHPGRYLHV